MKWDEYKLLSKVDKEKIKYMTIELYINIFTSYFVFLFFLILSILGFDDKILGFIVSFMFVIYLILIGISFYKLVKLDVIKEEAKKKIKIKR